MPIQNLGNFCKNFSKQLSFNYGKYCRSVIVPVVEDVQDLPAAGGGEGGLGCVGGHGVAVQQVRLARALKHNQKYFVLINFKLCS